MRAQSRIFLSAFVLSRRLLFFFHLFFLLLWVTSYSQFLPTYRWLPIFPFFFFLAISTHNMSIYLSPAHLQRIHIWRNEVHKSCLLNHAGQAITAPPPLIAAEPDTPPATSSSNIHPSASNPGLFHSITHALSPAPPPDMHAFVELPRRSSRWRRWLNLPPKPQHTNMYTDATPAIPVPLHTPLDQFPDLVPPSESPSSVHAPPSVTSDDSMYSDSTDGRAPRGSQMIEEKQARLRSAQKLLIKTQQQERARMQAKAEAEQSSVQISPPPAVAVVAV